MEDLEQLRARLADLDDHAAIKALKVRYARFADAGYDADGIASLFVAGGVWDGGALFGRAEGHEAIRAQFRDASKWLPWALHFTLSPEIELIGGPGPGRRATATWYLWQPCVRRRSNGSEHQAFLTGTYLDHLVKTDEGWKFESLVVDARWFTGPAPAVAPPAG